LTVKVRELRTLTLLPWNYN